MMIMSTLKSQNKLLSFRCEFFQNYYTSINSWKKLSYLVRIDLLDKLYIACIEAVLRLNIYCPIVNNSVNPLHSESETDQYKITLCTIIAIIDTHCGNCY